MFSSQERDLQALREKLSASTDTPRATIRETKSVPYTAYRDEVVETEAVVVSKIQTIKAIRDGSWITRNNTFTGDALPDGRLGLGETKGIVDALWNQGYRLVKIEE